MINPHPLQDKIKTLEFHLAKIRDFKEAPEHRQWLIKYANNYSFFYDRVLVLTRRALKLYQKRERISDSQLAKHLVETKENLFFGEVPTRPKDIVFRRHKTFYETKLSPRSWNLASAACSLCGMAFYCAGMSDIESDTSLTQNQKAVKINHIIPKWDAQFVEFAAAFLLVESSAREKSGAASVEVRTKKADEIKDLAKKILGKTKCTMEDATRVSAELEKKHGIKRKPKTIYYWF